MMNPPNGTQKMSSRQNHMANPFPRATTNIPMIDMMYAAVIL